MTIPPILQGLLGRRVGALVLAVVLPVAWMPVHAATSTAKKSAQRTHTSAAPIRASKKVAPRSVVRVTPDKPSFGALYGLHGTADPLELKSSVALVIDQDTNEVLFSKNPQAVLPIASITKLMTALVVTEAGLPLDETLTMTAGRRRHREGQPLSPDRGHPAQSREDAAPGADVVREPRRPRAGAQLPGRAWRPSSRR